jgi:rsbT co-antagonist protein RsbR
MRTNLRHWLNDTPLRDPVERRQAPLLQIMLIGMIIAASLALLNNQIAPNTLERRLLGTTVNMLLILCTASGLVVLRRGRFRLAVLIPATGITLIVGVFLIALGLRNGAPFLIVFALPITLAGLLAGRRTLFAVLGISLASVIIMLILQRIAPALTGFVPVGDSTALIVVAFILVTCVLGLLLDRFGSSLNSALQDALAREQELEHLRASLETNVAERTASLQQALEEREQRQARLAQALDDLRISQTTIHELSAPVIPVLPGVLIAPLIGALDSGRAAALADNILGTVERARADQVIFDITGVPVVDTQVARVLLQTAAAVRLLGAQTLLVGIRPEVAQTIITLGIDFAAIATYPSLQEAVAAILVQRAESGLNGSERAR